MRPPCLCTMAWDMAKPKPVPVARRAFGTRSNGYVVKPFDLKSLTESVAKAFATKP